MATDAQPSTTALAPLQTRIAAFRGFPHKMLVALLSDPDKSINAHLADIGIAIGTYYSWRGSLPDYAATVDAIRDFAGNIRSEAVKAIWDSYAQPLAIRMAERGLTEGRDSQRAAERILETVGVLPKPGADLQQAPIQVVTHTYVLVQPAPDSQGAIVETTAKELPPKAS